MSARVQRGTFKRSCRRCGWEGTYATAGMADNRKKRHACDTRLAKNERSKAYAEKIAAIDRTPKPCLHKQANHQHGTNAAYVLDKCRCLPCSKARVGQDAWRNRQKAYGRYDVYVDAQPVRDHIRSLMDAGMGLKRIVAVSDASQGQLWKLLYGKKRPDGTRTPSKRITKAVAERLLAVEADLADGAKVDGTGTRRRLQALVALGYSMTSLGREVDITNIHRTIHGAGDGLVVKSTADITRTVYDRLSMTPNQPDTWHDKIAASRARAYAKAHGWLPPLAWDDDLIDDPTHQPLRHRDTGLTHVEHLDESAIYRRTHGDKNVRLSKAEAAELVHRWAAAGRPLADCERVTGIKPARHYRLKDQEVAS